MNEHPKKTIEEATKKSVEENGLNYRLWLNTKKNIVPTPKKQDKTNYNKVWLLENKLNMVPQTRQIKTNGPSAKKPLNFLV